MDHSTQFDPNAPTLVGEPATLKLKKTQIVKRQFSHEQGNSIKDVAYPQIRGLSSRYIERRINTYLRTKFLSLDAPEDVGHLYEDDEDKNERQYEEQVDFSVTLVTDTTLSVRMLSYLDFGGAHPTHYYEAFNIDLRSGYRYTYEDLFLMDSDFRNTIPELVVASLQAQAKENNDSYYAFEPKETFEFFLSKKNLVIFNLYSQHVMQMIEAPVKLTDIAELIHPEGPLYPLLRM